MNKCVTNVQKKYTYHTPINHMPIMHKKYACFPPKLWIRKERLIAWEVERGKTVHNRALMWEKQR